MLLHWIFYLIVLSLSVILLCANSAWIFWIAFLFLLAAPLLSLLLSLPGILSRRFTLEAPEETKAGTGFTAAAGCGPSRFLPFPDCRMRLQITEQATGRTTVRRISGIRERTEITEETPCCGVYTVTPAAARCYDALNLFRIPRKTPAAREIVSLPEPVAMEEKYALSDLLPNAFRPKTGGGYSENYDNREYRPGDNVRQIQWKLSRKGDKLIVKEPLEPVRQRVVLAAETPKDAEEMALLLGRVYWLSGVLCEADCPHEVCWMEGNVRRLFPVDGESACEKMIREMCRIRPREAASLTLDGLSADRLYSVSGGEEAAQ